MDVELHSGIVPDSVSPLLIAAYKISLWEAEVLQEFLQAASDSDGDDAAKTQVGLFKLSLLCECAAFGDRDLNRVPPPGRHAVEEIRAKGFPCGAPGHQQHFGGQPMR